MFIKSKRFWLSLTTGMASLATVSLAVACGTSNQDEVIKVDNFIIDVPESIQNAAKTTLTNAESIRSANIAVLTAGGNVADRSFNQSSFEVSQLLKVTIDAIQGAPKVNIRPFNTSSATNTVLGQTYTAALVSQNIWIASGFQHEEALKAWLGNSRNRDEFIRKNILIVGIDWTAADNSDFTWPPGQVISLNFKTQESSYVLGYAAAEYLSKTFPNAGDSAKRSLVTFGGGDFPGVTNFNYGFIEGAIAFNNQARENNLPTVSWPDGASQNIELTTNFDPSNAEAAAKVNTVVTTGAPSIIFPVAGPLIGNVFNIIGTNNQNTLVIGVDTDQSLAFPNNAGSIFSSSLKNIAAAIYQVLVPFLAQKKDDPFLVGVEGNSATAATFSFKGDGGTAKNVNILRGLSDNFVATSKTTVTGTDVQKTITDAIVNGLTSFNTVGSDQLGKRVIAPGDAAFLNGRIQALIASAAPKPAETTSS